MDRTASRSGPVRSVLVAFGVAIAGIFVAELFTIPVLVLEPALLAEPGAVGRSAALSFLVLQFLGMAAVGGAYLAATGRSRAWLDLRRPSGAARRYLVGSVVAAVALVGAIDLAVSALDLPVAPNVIYEIVGDDATMALLMIGVVWLFNAPAEEFLFRNVVQKRLYAAFSRTGAVLVASVLFALLHVPAYAVLADSRLAILVSLSVMLVGALFFGYVYARSDNLIVPIAAHGTFNTVQFVLLYLHVRYGWWGELPTTELLVL